MELHEIEVEIDAQGRVTVSVRGVKGDSCLTVTKALESALGGDVITREMTPEADETGEERVGDQQWQADG